MSNVVTSTGFKLKPICPTKIISVYSPDPFFKRSLELSLTYTLPSVDMILTNDWMFVIICPSESSKFTFIVSFIGYPDATNRSS